MIIPMKKVTLYAFKTEREKLLRALQKNALVMVTESDGSITDERLAETAEQLADASGALKFASRYREKKPMFAPRTEVGYEQLTQNDERARLLEQQAMQTAAEITEAEKNIAQLKAAISALAPWCGMELVFGEPLETRNTTYFCGTLPASAAAAAEFPESAAVILGEGSIAAKTIIAICHRQHAAEVYEQLKALGFADAPAPDITGTAEQEIAALKSEQLKSETELETLKEQAAELAKEITELEILNDGLKTDAALYATPYSETEKLFYIEGWVRADCEETLRNVVAKTTDMYELELRDPLEDEQPPTAVKNNRFVTPFESITDMFSRPDPRGVDPNPVMAPWYWIIFGMMMADAGYGLVLVVLIFLYKKIAKPVGKPGLIDILMYSGFTTMFWGVMFGSYFGAEIFPPVLFAPLYEPISMLVLCMIVGVLHIFTGLITKMYELIKAGHWLDAIFDQFSWILLITGIGMLVLPATAAIGKIVALVGAGIILLTAGRAKKGIFSKITGGLLGLYDITSYMSDIISYSRILALMLSSGVVAMVMNILAGMVQGSVFGYAMSILIYIVGHVFNLVLGLLSAYVHASRLQYIEFFGKFYDGGGYEFKPLSAKTDYVVVDSKE